MQKELNSTLKKILGAGFGLFLIVIWQLVATAIDTTYILPSPIQVMEELWDSKVQIFTVDLPATMNVVAIGAAISIVLGVAFALLMDF